VQEKLRTRLLIATTLTALVGPGTAVSGEEGYRFELTPYLGYRLGGTFAGQDSESEFELEDSAAQGLMLSGRVQENTQWEVLLGRQGTDVDTQGVFVDDPALDIDVDYVHLGGTYLFEGANVRPFIAFTLGVTRFDPAPGEYGSESFFSASFGGGWQLNATQRLGIRLEARVFTTFVDNDSDIFCQSDAAGGACLILTEADTLTQLEARAGLVFRF
jgi:hypothetical protein